MTLINNRITTPKESIREQNFQKISNSSKLNNFSWDTGDKLQERAVRQRVRNLENTLFDEYIEELSASRFTL